MPRCIKNGVAAEVIVSARRTEAARDGLAGARRGGDNRAAAGRLGRLCCEDCDIAPLAHEAGQWASAAMPKTRSGRGGYGRCLPT